MAQDSFIDALLPAGFGRNERLERISGLIDWNRLAALVRKVRPGETGRPPYEPLAMFKALLLQQWYGLSDPGLEPLADRDWRHRFALFHTRVEAGPVGVAQRIATHRGLVDVQRHIGSRERVV